MCIVKFGTWKKNIYWPDWKIPCAINYRAQIYHGLCGDRRKLYQYRTYENIIEYEMIRAYQVLLKRIAETGVCSRKRHILYNEASDEFKRFIEKKSKLQLVLPDTHQINIEETEIQTFKNHLVAIFLGVDPIFPNVLVVYITPIDNTYLEFGEAIPCWAKSISTRIFACIFWLKWHATSTTRMRSAYVCQTK